MNENHDPKTGEFSSGGGGGGGKDSHDVRKRLAMGITDNRDAPARASPAKDTTPKDVRQRLAQGITDNRDAHTNMDKTTNTAHEHTRQSVVGMTRYSPSEHPNAQQRASQDTPKKMTVLQKRMDSKRRLALGITDNRDAPKSAPRVRDTTPREVRHRLAHGLTKY